jgi:DNA-binding NarL/FixJ family response regulator
LDQKVCFHIFITMKKIRIAIFEDNQQFRESLEYIVLSNEQFELGGCFPDASRLESRILESRPDVVLMDINMPGISGIEAVALIKKQFPAIQVCMQTVFEEDDKVFASLCAGASGYILKNTRPDKLLQAVTEVAEGGAFFAPSIAKKILSNFQQQPEQAEYIKLSEREKDILRNMVDGQSYKMISASLHITYGTVHTHIKNIYEKLHVNSKSEAVVKALKQKLI